MFSLANLKARHNAALTAADPPPAVPTAPAVPPAAPTVPASRNGRGAAVPSAPKRKAAKASAALGLAAVIGTYRKWLDFPDPGALEMMLGAYAANRLAGDPVWVLLVGPSSGGKGEVINPFETLPYTHRAAQVSEASLLSGTGRDSRSDDATGGLLYQVGEFGILVMKDLTSVFTMNRDERGTALSALRHCYDGSWFRPLGAEGGRVLRWEGKLGIIGGVTEAIDTEHAVMASLGPRFLLYRLPRGNAVKQAESALDTRQQEREMRAELSTAIKLFFDPLDFKLIFYTTPAEVVHFQ